MSSMLLEARRWHVLVPPLLLHVTIGERLLRVHSHVGHVARGHVALRHPGPALLRRQVSVGGLLWGVDGIRVVHAVVAGRRFRRVQASLESACQKGDHDARDTESVPLDWGRMSYLNQVLALSLGDQRLQLWGGESVDKTGFRHNEEQDLSACQH